ncbi:MAG: rod shape-determining protein [Armatimonadota bacterium]
MLRWGEQVGLDLGTSHTQVCVRGQGVVVRQPTAIAYAEGKRGVYATGEEARLMEGRDIPGVRVVRPMRGGVVADFEAAADLVRQCLREALGGRPLFSPVVVAAAPTESTPVEQRALHDCLRNAGAGRVYLVPKGLAAGRGLQQPIDEAEARMIVDLGAGATDIGIMSMGAITGGRSLHYAGDDLDEALVRWVKRRNGARIGPQTAEQIKVRVSAVAPGLARQHISMDDLQSNNGDLLDAEVPLHEVPEVLARAIAPVAGEIRWLLEELPAERRSELSANGMAITGGTALLRGLAALMEEKTGLPVTVARDPLSCTILGIESILDDLDSLSLSGRRFVHPIGEGEE